jgi:RNA polymerase sigma-70 factor, ECF subfamily
MHKDKDFPDFDQLLLLMKEGDLEAFDLLYRSSRERLYILARTIIPDSPAARDLVQDFFIDFWRQQRFLSIEGGLKTYLVRSILNRAYNYVEKERTRQKLVAAYRPAAALDITVLDKLQNDNLGQELEAAISRLPPMAAKVFRLHYQEKRSYAEIAGELKISTSTVGGHMERALRQLREELKKMTKN